MTDPLEALSRRMENRPFFLAPLLAAYARSEGLDDAGLAGVLGCSPGLLVDLRLCRAPRETPPGFGEDIERISKHFGIADHRLIKVVRLGQALVHAQERAAAPGQFLAARDAEPKTEGQS
jgi:hypothetical protein